MTLEMALGPSDAADDEALDSALEAAEVIDLITEDRELSTD